MWGKEDPFHDVRNRFPWLTPTEIAAMCHDLSRELRRKDVQRTAEERLQLTLNVAAILDRVGEPITGEHHGGTQTPERDCVVNKAPVGRSLLLRLVTMVELTTIKIRVVNFVRAIDLIRPNIRTRRCRIGRSDDAWIICFPVD
jgi:hypothetical protein